MKGSKELQPKTFNQEQYAAALQSPVAYIIATGPAGTGKTALACQAAANAMRGEQYKRILITRPAVNADEELGFLPGSMEDKLMPYVQPMIDSFALVLSEMKVDEMLTNGSIEIAPLAFMRGRTFEGTFVLADEMQNATPEQIKHCC